LNAEVISSSPSTWIMAVYIPYFTVRIIDGSRIMQIPTVLAALAVVCCPKVAVIVQIETVSRRPQVGETVAHEDLGKNRQLFLPKHAENCCRNRIECGFSLAHVCWLRVFTRPFCAKHTSCASNTRLRRVGDAVSRCSNHLQNAFQRS
jgi:hypothetical protein